MRRDYDRRPTTASAPDDDGSTGSSRRSELAGPGAEGTPSHDGEAKRSKPTRDPSHASTTRPAESLGTVAATSPLPRCQTPAGRGAGDRGTDARERGASTESGSGALGGEAEGERSSSVLDRPQPDKCAPALRISADGVLWLSLLDHESEGWRSELAERHRHVADRAEARGAITTADWHRARASGLARRYQAPARCGLDILTKLCRCCGSVETKALGCKRFSVCAHCRKTRANKRATDLREGMKRHASSPRARATALEGWRWRWVTLTVPHTAGVEATTTAIPKAWARLRRRILARITGRSRRSELAYVRSLEITASDGGHAHVHALVWSPWLSQAWLGVEWGRALEAVGVKVPRVELAPLLERERTRRGEREASSLAMRLRDGRTRRDAVMVPWVIVDVRAIDTRDNDALTAYAAKGVSTYAAKGAATDAGGVLEVASRIERALYGRRTWQATRGLCRPKDPVCNECGERAWAGLVERVEAWRADWVVMRGTDRAPPG